MRGYRWADAVGAALLGLGLVVASAAPAGATFPGGDGLVAFVSSRITGSPAIYLVNPSGPGIGTGTGDPANTTQLTAGYTAGATTSGADSEPAFSSDGTEVAFASDRNGSWQIFTIPVADAAPVGSLPSDQAALVSQAPGGGFDDYSPSFAPGTDCEVIFNRANSGLYTLDPCAADPAGTVTLLFSTSLAPQGSDGSDSRAVFDPADPTKVVYVGGNNHIYELTGVGTPSYNPSQTPIDLSAASGLPATAADANPDWAPDGSQIIFDTTRSGSVHQLWVMNPDGSSAHPYYAGPASDTQPVFSPDGLASAFTQSAQSQDVFDVAGAAGTPVDLTLVGAGPTGPADDQPAWQPVPTTPPIVPESRYAVLLPGGALLVGAVVLRRRRSGRGSGRGRRSPGAGRSASRSPRSSGIQ